jgi:hypothetical protein
MAAFDLIREPLDRFLRAARRLADLCVAALDNRDFLDDIWRLRRDLPHLSRDVMAAFRGGGGGERPAGGLRHRLNCVCEDADALAAWIGPAREELQRLFEAILKGGDPAGASLRYGERQSAAFAECERQRQVVFVSCNKTFGAACNQTVSAADEVCNEATAEQIASKLRKEQEGNDSPPPRAMKKTMTVAQANEKAMELAKKMKNDFFLLSQRGQAEKIGCSWQTWTKTPFYLEAKKRRGQVARKIAAGKRPCSPPVISLTSNLEAVTGEGEREEILERLIEEHDREREPSPLDTTSRRTIRCRKRL